MTCESELLNIAVGNVNEQNSSLRVINFFIPFDPDILHGIYLKEMTIDMVKDLAIDMFMMMVLIIMINCKHPKCPIKQMVVK